MKILAIQPGGHPRKNEDLTQVQASVTDLAKAYNSRYVLPNTLIKGVILSGLVLTANGALYDCSGGWVAVGEQVYAVAGALGLDMSGGKKLFLEILALQGASVTMASGSQTQPYIDYQMSVYTALVKNTVGDYEVGSSAEIVPYGDWVAAVINFDGSAYLPSAQGAWQTIVAAGGTSSTGWINGTRPLKVRKDQCSNVHLSGFMANLIAPNFNPEIVYLPVGFRPVLNERRFIVPAPYAVYNSNWRGNRIAEIVIGMDGRVAIEAYNLDLTIQFVVGLDLIFSAL